MKRLAIFDLDDVLYEGQSQQTLLAVLRAEGLLGMADYVAISAYFAAYCAGLRRPEAVRAFAFGRLAGLEVRALEAAIDRRLKEFVRRLRSNARALVESHRAAGEDLVLVSASIEPVVRRIASLLAIPHYFATRLARDDATFTGKLAGEVPYGAVRASLVARHAGGWDALKRSATFYTDHHSDLPLLAAVRTPVCVNPTRLLRRVARELDWRILGVR